MTKSVKVAGAVIFIILLNTGLFVLEDIKLTSFWISWAFIHIAFGILVYVLIFSAAGQKKILTAYSEAAVVIYYFIVQLIAGLVFLVQFALFPVMSFVIQLILLAVFIIAFGAVKKMNHNIEHEEAALDVDLKRFKLIQDTMKMVMNQVDYTAPYKKLVEHAFDAVNSSPVRSVAGTRQQEQNILDWVNQLRNEIEAQNEEGIKSLCKKIEEEAERRNMVLHASR